ncbi:MAG TPA: hypothetical protein VFT42_01940 [Solirubrobacteraceae bacterium]|nr:hypothetical protein [Solirubrobacteraceae bacterium]
MRFDVDRIEAGSGRLIVSGFWSGVRGMRFMRPTLIVGDREVLATLDHKPWTPSDEVPWIAAFPWDDAAPDPADASIAVAPSLTVPLAPGAEPQAAQRPAARAAAPSKKAHAAPQPEPAAVEAPAPDPLRDELADARRRAEAAEAARDEARHARTISERERDQALAQRDEAAKDRDAAVRARTRMEAQLEDQIAQRKEAEAAREEAIAQREEMRAQREETLLAHRALQRRLAADGAAPPPADEREPPQHADPDRPIGVRAIPAARAVAPELHRTERAATPRVTHYDIWAIRILGSIAALCFIGFLVLLLRLVL